MTEKEIIELYREVRHDYDPDPDMMTREGDVTRRLKVALSRMTPTDRTIMVLYAECRSLRKLGAILGVSRTTAQAEIRRIRKLILKEYEHIR